MLQVPKDGHYHGRVATFPNRSKLRFDGVQIQKGLRGMLPNAITCQFQDRGVSTFISPNKQQL